jgi:L-ascorbate metabolism protein UlaG (beta-lactamase superfamily)
MTDECSLLFIGTATMVLRFGPITVLTDPNFLHRGQRAYLGHGLSSKRITDPALGVSDLPELDGIVLSHMHGDHWDRVARNGLDHDLPIITTPKAARALHRQRFAAAEGLATWASTDLDKAGHRLTVTSLPGRHATGLARHLLPPVMGSMLEYRNASGELVLRLYISGDTLFVDDLRSIPDRYPDIDVAVLHLGGTTLPGGLLVTMDAQQGADLMQLLAAPATVPVHHSDYTVFRSPLSDFIAEVARRDLTDRLLTVRPGQQLTLPRRSGRG